MNASPGPREATQPWLRNAWYQFGWVDEIEPGAMISRTILGEPLLVFRDESGALSALTDRCPHRFAPLSAGRVEGGAVRCGYHGLAFDGAGRCVHNPHGAATSAMRVAAFPVVERHTAIWVWTGAAEQADPSLIPDLAFIDETPESATIRGSMPTRANYQLIVDNILDLSHADYIHPTTLGGMMTDATVKTRERDGRVHTRWEALDCATPPPPFRAQVPPPSNVDIRIEVEWQAPCLMTLGVSAMPAGVAPSASDEAWTLHSVTPETLTTSHYFYCSTRRTNLDDMGFTAFLRGSIEKAFLEEDKPMLERQQERVGTADLWSLQPVLLSVDNGAVRARRRLQALIEAEVRENI